MDFFHICAGGIQSLDSVVSPWNNSSGGELPVTSFGIAVSGIPRGWKQIKVNGSSVLSNTIQHHGYYSVGLRKSVDSSEDIRGTKFICSFDVLWRKGVLLQSVSKQNTERSCDSIICYHRGDPKEDLFGELQYFLLGTNSQEKEAVLMAILPVPSVAQMLKERTVRQQSEVVLITDQEFWGPAVGVRLHDDFVVGRKFVTPENGLIL